MAASLARRCFSSGGQIADGASPWVMINVVTFQGLTMHRRFSRVFRVIQIPLLFSVLGLLGAPSAQAQVPSPCKAQGAGAQCALSADGRDLACVLGAEVVVNDKAVYSLPGFSGIGTEFQRFELAAGASTLTTTNPPFRVEVKEILKDAIRLRLTTQDRLWTETQVKNGYAVTLPVGGKGDEESVIFGVIPKIKPGDAGVVSVSIRKGSSSTVESGPVWDPSGKRLAFVELNADGKRSLLLLSKAVDKAEVDMRKRLPIGGPVSLIEFPADTRIRIVGKARVYELEVPVQGKVPENARYETKPVPRSLASLKAGGEPKVEEVKGTACP